MILVFLDTQMLRERHYCCLPSGFLVEGVNERGWKQQNQENSKIS